MVHLFLKPQSIRIALLAFHTSVALPALELPGTHIERSFFKRESIKGRPIGGILVHAVRAYILGIVLIIAPVHWIVKDVSSNPIKVVAISDDMIVIVSLPSKLSMT
jgi:hypothetical protein